MALYKSVYLLGAQLRTVEFYCSKHFVCMPLLTAFSVFIFGRSCESSPEWCYLHSPYIGGKQN